MRISLVEFAKYLRTLNRADKTIEAYIRDLLRLDGEELNDDLIREYLTQLRKYKPATRSRKLSALRALLRFYHYDYDLPSVKIPDNRREYKIITPEEFNKAIENLPFRQQCILKFLYYYGLRVSELKSLKIREGALTVERKGGKVQRLPILDNVQPCLQYLPFRISRQYIYIITKQVLGVSPHHLRASALTRLGKVSPTAATVLAGHSSPRTTMRYIQPSTDDLQRALEESLKPS